MNGRSHRGRVAILLTALVTTFAAAGMAAWAQAPEGGDAGQAPKTSAPADQPKTDEARAAPDAPPSDEDFVPSERIPADASIAFPVDI